MPGLAKERIIRQKCQTILEMLVNPTVSLCYSDPWWLIAQTLGRSVGNRRVTEMTMAMFFLAGWIEGPHAGLNSNLANRITATFRTYNPKESRYNETLLDIVIESG
jgi:hypothetical protein